MKPYRGKLPIGEIQRLRARGWSCARIAAAVGGHPNTVECALKRLGVGAWRKYRRWTPKEDACLRKMWLAGATARDIATRLGRKVNEVWGRRLRLKLPPRHVSHGAFTPDERELIKSGWGTIPVRELSRRVSRGTATVHAFATRKLGLPHLRAL